MKLFSLLLPVWLMAGMIPADHPTPYTVWFPDPLQWNENGLENFCELWPAACMLERVELFGSDPRDVSPALCTPAALFGQANVYLLGCPEPEGFMESVYAPPSVCVDCKPMPNPNPNPTPTPVPEPSSVALMVVVLATMLVAARIRGRAA